MKMKAQNTEIPIPQVNQNNMNGIMFRDKAKTKMLEIK